MKLLIGGEGVTNARDENSLPSALQAISTCNGKEPGEDSADSAIDVCLLSTPQDTCLGERREADL